MVLSVLVLLLAQQGEVRLPLAEYLDLVGRAEAAQQIAAADAVIAELTSQTTSMVWEDEGVEITARYEVQLRGTPTVPVELPVTGLVWNVSITPSGNASVEATPMGLRFIAPEPGRYQIEVRSRAATDGRGVGTLKLAPFLAPVGEYDVELPEDLLFRCPGAVVSRDEIRDGRRFVHFAVPRGEGRVIEARRDLESADAEALLASVEIATLIDLTADGALRHDILLYRVSRGRMDVHEVTLPPGLIVERTATDEGRVPPLVGAEVLRVQRKAKLDRQGYLVVTSRPEDGSTLSLAPVTSNHETRARYLAVASSIAAEFGPLPRDAWLRIDLTDLPPTVRNAVSSVDPVSAWRWTGESAGASRADVALGLARKPEATMLETVVHERESLTLLTAEGTLVIRDRFTVSSEEPFRVQLSAGATLWSASVNDVLVRPLERGADLLVPLGFGNSERATLEVVSIQEKALPEQKSRIALTLPEVAAPVLAHSWRLMLPEGNRYRFVGGDLQPAVEQPPVPAAGRFAADASARALGMGGSASLWGRVFDESGYYLPGATVTLTNEGSGWSATVNADRNGSFWFVALPGGSYSLVTQLAGFQTSYYEGVRISSGQNAAYRITLGIATVSESITVTGASPPVLTELESQEEKVARREMAAEASGLRAGLAGGVKPLPVVIPESGKVLTLTGALPPPAIRVELEVKPR